MNTRKLITVIARHLLILSLLVPALAAAADFVVVVNPTNGATSLTRAELRRLFMRNTTVWPGGTAAYPVDLPKRSPTRAAFTEDVLGQSIAALDRYWVQSVYSGRAVPPPERKTDQDVLDHVRDTPGGIGYVSAGAPLSGVKRITVSD